MAQDKSRSESTPIVPVRVHEAVRPGPDQPPSYCEGLKVGDVEIRLRSDSWRDDPFVAARLTS
jgi:hypothetical protein